MSNLLIYLMFLLRLPRRVSSRLEKIQRDFLWGSSPSIRKIHLLNWKTVCTSKVKGGLGIRSPALMNEALLGKWAWRFAEEENSAWKSIIRLKYGLEDRGWFMRIPRKSAGTRLWKGISKVVAKLKQDYIFELGKERGSDFGKMFGVESHPYVPCSLLSIV